MDRQQRQDRLEDALREWGAWRKAHKARARIYGIVAAIVALWIFGAPFALMLPHTDFGAFVVGGMIYMVVGLALIRIMLPILDWLTG